MKNYRETYIRRAEIAQLIILHQLYMQKGSGELIFQGGTALRWCYGGARFSEDLDFVTPLTPESIKKILTGALRGVEKVMVPHFGVGALTMVEKKSRANALKCFVHFRPEASREKLSVKLEFEGIIEKSLPKRNNHVLSSLPAVAYLITTGEFRVPRPHTVIVAETPDEILSDKVRSLLERKYLKGRDLFDVWHLCDNLKASIDMEIVQRKLTMYRETFIARRDINYFASPSKQNEKEMREAMALDLSRFLPPEVLAVHRADGFTVFLQATRLLFSGLKEKGMILP